MLTVAGIRASAALAAGNLVAYDHWQRLASRAGDRLADDCGLYSRCGVCGDPWPVEGRPCVLCRALGGRAR